MPVQNSNLENVDLLAPYFPLRQEPNYALPVIMASMLALTGLRGFWPMASVDENGNTYDLSGQGRTLSYAGSAVYTWDGLSPYVYLDGAGDYLFRADEAGLDIIGTETYIHSPSRGLTLGGWFYPTGFAALQGLICKGDAASAAGSAYNLTLTAGALAQLDVYNAGNVYSQASAAVGANLWHFIVGRYDPSTHVAIYTDGTWATNAVGIPASLNSVAAPFNVGSINSGSFLLTGRASLCFICAAALSDTTIANLYQQSRVLFGL